MKIIKATRIPPPLEPLNDKIVIYATIIKKLAKKGLYDAFITFGAIVKGDTYHFEQIANECARGCMDVSLQYEVPVIFEVLAVYDRRQFKFSGDASVEHEFRDPTRKRDALLGLFQFSGFER